MVILSPILRTALSTSGPRVTIEYDKTKSLNVKSVGTTVAVEKGAPVSALNATGGPAGAKIFAIVSKVNYTLIEPIIPVGKYLSASLKIQGSGPYREKTSFTAHDLPSHP